MAFYIDWAEKIQAARLLLEQSTQINDPRNYSKYTGFINFLLNKSQNPSNIEAVQRQTSNSGQYRPVEIRYRPHKGSDELVTNDANATCSNTDQTREYIDTYQPQLFVMDKFTIDENWLRQNRESSEAVGSVLAKEFQDSMRVCRESLDSQLVAKAVGLIGSNPAQGAASGSYSSIEMLKSDGTINADTFDTIQNDLEDNFMTGTPALFGMGNIRKVFNRYAVGNLNTSGGFDVREIASEFGSVLYKDQFVSSAVGDTTKILALYPGLTQYYQYNLNQNPSGDPFAPYETSGLKVKGTMADPVFPITWDYDLKYDDGCNGGNGIGNGSWTGRVYLYFDLFTTPERAFGEPYGDLVDFNGILGYDITQAS